MTRKMKTITLIAAALTAAPALAMTELDANGDGVLTINELQAVYPEMTEDQFLQADGDADGLITEEELATARETGLIPEDQG